MTRVRTLMAFHSAALILCLLASNASICACRHHAESEPIEEVSSCHQHESAPSSHSTEPSVEDGPTISDCECACFDRAPQVYAKFGHLKITKAPATATIGTAKVEHILTVVAVSENVLERPSYLSDSFYNLSPGRAPPTL